MKEMVFLMHRPSNAEIERFLERSHKLPLSYYPIGIVRDPRRLSIDSSTG